MSIEEAAAKVFRMTDAVWERHANPWSVWTRFPCLPLLALGIWSRVWIGWLSVLPIVLIVLWIWLNPRVFGKPSTTDYWASRAVMGERILLEHDRSLIPQHHRKAISILNALTFAGFAAAVYGLFVLDAALAVFGTLVTMIGKLWFLDRMVWLYQDLSSSDERYSGWLY